LASGPFENAERGHCFNGRLFGRALIAWCARKSYRWISSAGTNISTPPRSSLTSSKCCVVFSRRSRTWNVRPGPSSSPNGTKAWWADPPQDNELWGSLVRQHTHPRRHSVRRHQTVLLLRQAGRPRFSRGLQPDPGREPSQTQYHVVSIFNQLRGVWLEVAGTDGELSCVAAWTGRAHDWRFVLVNHVDRYNVSRRVRLKISNPVPGRLREYRVDATTQQRVS